MPKTLTKIGLGVVAIAIALTAFASGYAISADPKDAYLSKSALIGTVVVGGMISKANLLTPGELRTCNVALEAANKLAPEDPVAANEYIWTCGQLLIKASQRTEAPQNS